MVASSRGSFAAVPCGLLDLDHWNLDLPAPRWMKRINAESVTELHLQSRCWHAAASSSPESAVVVVLLLLLLLLFFCELVPPQW